MNYPVPEEGADDASVGGRLDPGGGGLRWFHAATCHARFDVLDAGECPITPALRANLDAALTALALPLDYAVVDLDTLPSTDARTGYPIPTVLYRERDLFGMPEPTPPFPDPT